MLRTPERYREDLGRMRPNVYVGGQLVQRDDPRIQPGVNVMSLTFELAQQAEWKSVMTANSHLNGEEINRFTHLPQSPRDLLQKQKMVRLLAQRVGGCIQRCMGHDALTALSICTKEMDEDKGTDYHSRFLEYLRFYQANDLAAACAQTDMKGDRTKRPSAQPNPDAYVHIVEESEKGIVVRGAKISITMAAYADELIVLPTRALKEDDRDYAVPSLSRPTGTGCGSSPGLSGCGRESRYSVPSVITGFLTLSWSLTIPSFQGSACSCAVSGTSEEGWRFCSPIRTDTATQAASLRSRISSVAQRLW